MWVQHGAFVVEISSLLKLLADAWTRISSSVEPQEQASQELRADFQKDWYDIWEYFKQRKDTLALEESFFILG